MNILIAPDSFKHARSALEVARSLERGIMKALPEARIRLLPMADGGEGTVESVIDATGGERVSVPVHDPLMRERQAAFGVAGDGRTAVIEMAAASGLQLISTEERNPWITTTCGTGELILAALDRGCTRLMIGIGGSATNDCGMGMAAALGARFLDANGNEVEQGGGALGKIETIDVGGQDPRVQESEVIVMCDVNNPLTGPEGASQVYGPQKGAGPEMVRKLDANLAHFAALIHDQLGKEVSEVPGAGAAGGLGAGLIAFLDGKLTAGVAAVAESVGLADAVAAADLVITGEGAIDAQTRFGKTPFGVASLAMQEGKPVIAVAGTVGEGAEVLYDHGFDAIFPIADRPMSLEEAISRTDQLLEATGERIARLLKSNHKFPY